MRRMLGYEEISLKDNEFTTQWYSVVTDEEINIIESVIKERK